MRALAVLPILLAVCARADDSADRLGVMRTILALNELPPRNSLFTADASVAPEFSRLAEGKRIAYRPIRPAAGARPTVTISHEPWGEATIGIPPIRVEIVNPRIVTDDVRFLTADIAIADGASVYDSAAGRERTRLFFVLRREGEEWKIAVIRILDVH